MNTLGWTEDNPTSLFTMGWIGGTVIPAINGIISIALSAFGIDFEGDNGSIHPREDVFRLARILNASGRSTVHANPAIARIAERLKRGPGGPRFH